VLSLPLIDLQILSFSSFEVTGNLLNTAVFKEFSLMLLMHPFFVCTICVAVHEFLFGKKVRQQL